MLSKRKICGISACLLTLALDITAGILAMKAKEAQNHAKHLRVWIFECSKGRSHDAFVLGVAAATLLGVAHFFTILLCLCGAFKNQDEPRKSPLSKNFSKALFICTWIISAVGVTMLVVGTRSNEKSGLKCGFEFTYHNFLPTGGILCFVHAIFSLAYYVTSASALYTN